MRVANFLTRRFIDADGMPRLLRLLEGLLLVLLAVQAARLLWLTQPAAPIGDAAPALPAAIPTVPRIDLFHRSDAPVAGAAADVGGYRLRGVRVDARGGSAILLDAAGKQQSWAVGDTIAPGIVLAGVGPGYAALRGPDGTQRLQLPAAAGAAAATPALPASLPPNGAGTGTIASPGIDPAAMLAQAGLGPNEAGGYTVNPRGDDALLRAAGLQGGDVVIAVNGTTLNAENVTTFPGELAPGAALTLSIRRGGQPRTITIPAPQPR